jgi:hypothetical protein
MVRHGMSWHPTHPRRPRPASSSQPVDRRGLSTQKDGCRDQRRDVWQTAFPLERPFDPTSVMRPVHRTTVWTSFKKMSCPFGAGALWFAGACGAASVRPGASDEILEASPTAAEPPTEQTECLHDASPAEMRVRGFPCVAVEPLVRPQRPGAVRAYAVPARGGRRRRPTAQVAPTRSPCGWQTLPSARRPWAPRCQGGVSSRFLARQDRFRAARALWLIGELPLPARYIRSRLSSPIVLRKCQISSAFVCTRG